MPVVNPDHLLDQSDYLIASAVGARRQVDLRRAISNAYYALFHAALTEAADDFVGKRNRQTFRYAAVYRSVSHKYLRNLCDDITKDSLPAKYSSSVPSGGFGSEITEYAAALSSLQERRHTADYDPLANTRLSDASLAVAESRSALAKFRQVSRAQKKAFSTLVVFAPF